MYSLVSKSALSNLLDAVKSSDDSNLKACLKTVGDIGSAAVSLAENARLNQTSLAKSRAEIALKAWKTKYSIGNSSVSELLNSVPSKEDVRMIAEAGIFIWSYLKIHFDLVQPQKSPSSLDDFEIILMDSVIQRTEEKVACELSKWVEKEGDELEWSGAQKIRVLLQSAVEAQRDLDSLFIMNLASSMTEEEWHDLWCGMKPSVRIEVNYVIRKFKAQVEPALQSESKAAV